MVVMRRKGWAIRAALAGVVLSALGACSGIRTEANYPTKEGQLAIPNPQGGRQTIFGEGGLNFFGGNDDKAAVGGGIGVNSFLWRASLDTTAFMPLSSADPFGGVIITDWYSPPQTPDERFKMTIYILDRRLRADGIKVAVFRQRRQGISSWADASITDQTSIDLENAILTRARQMRADFVEQ